MEWIARNHYVDCMRVKCRIECLCVRVCERVTLVLDEEWRRRRKITDGCRIELNDMLDWCSDLFLITCDLQSYYRVHMSTL